VNKQLKAAWIKALRSGEYEQGTELLKTGDGAYCCLGVLCKVAGKRIPSGEMNLDGFPALRKLRDECGLGKETGESIQANLTNLNDNERWSFKRIASWIAKNVPTDKP
jgi:hypothetical protein